MSRPYREEGGQDTVEDVHVHVERPAGKEAADLEDLGETLRGLDHVFEVHALRLSFQT